MTCDSTNVLGWQNASHHKLDDAESRRSQTQVASFPSSPQAKSSALRETGGSSAHLSPAGKRFHTRKELQESRAGLSSHSLIPEGRSRGRFSWPPDETEQLSFYEGTAQRYLTSHSAASG
eukprot:225060-Hanusia_phi.AAC.1